MNKKRKTFSVDAKHSRTTSNKIQYVAISIVNIVCIAKIINSLREEKKTNTSNGGTSNPAGVGSYKCHLFVIKSIPHGFTCCMNVC